MYHLFTKLSDGVRVNRWQADSLQAAKGYADQNWPHASCEIYLHSNGGGERVAHRTISGAWMNNDDMTTCPDCGTEYNGVDYWCCPTCRSR